MDTLLDRWRRAPLELQFLTAGGAVMLVAMLAVGLWITARIQQSVVDNTATSAALFLESFVSPLSQELAATDELSDPARRALDEVFADPALRARIVSFKIWKPGGLVVYASDPAIVGARFTPTNDLRRAWGGAVSGSFEELDDDESAAEAALGLPLLEVYSPIREVWSGEVVAVAEFYELATTLEHDLGDARLKSWLLVAAIFLGSGLALLGIVRAGGRTIDRQAALLREQIDASRRIAAQNSELRDRAVTASARATAETERRLRQVGADLHDGPAQYVALAAMRLDSILPDNAEGRREAATIREALQAALAEIRTISRGLSLPDLERLSVREIAERAVTSHRARAGAEVTLAVSEKGSGGAGDGAGNGANIDVSVKICLFRFLQEGLSNAARHAPQAPVAVEVALDGRQLSAKLRDDGPGFDPAASLGLRPDGGAGLAGLRDRAESIGGELRIITAPAAGTTLELVLPLHRGLAA